MSGEVRGYLSSSAYRGERADGKWLSWREVNQAVLFIHATFLSTVPQRRGSHESWDLSLLHRALLTFCYLLFLKVTGTGLEWTAGRPSEIRYPRLCRFYYVGVLMLTLE